MNGKHELKTPTGIIVVKMNQLLDPIEHTITRNKFNMCFAFLIWPATHREYNKFYRYSCGVSEVNV